MPHKKKVPMERLCEFGDVKIPILEIPVHHQPSLIIGRGSGRAILEHIDQIRQFVVKHEIMIHALEQMAEQQLYSDI